MDVANPGTTLPGPQAIAVDGPSSNQRGYSNRMRRNYANTQVEDQKTSVRPPGAAKERDVVAKVLHESQRNRVAEGTKQGDSKVNR